MTRKDKIGIVVLVSLFLAMLAILAVTVHPFSNTIRPPEKSVFVEQRIINLQKSK